MKSGPVPVTVPVARPVRLPSVPVPVTVRVPVTVTVPLPMRVPVAPVPSSKTLLLMQQALDQFYWMQSLQVANLSMNLVIELSMEVEIQKEPFQEEIMKHEIPSSKTLSPTLCERLCNICFQFLHCHTQEFKCNS